MTGPLYRLGAPPSCLSCEWRPWRHDVVNWDLRTTLLTPRTRSGASITSHPVSCRSKTKLCVRFQLACRTWESDSAVAPLLLASACRGQAWKKQNDTPEFLR